MKDIIIAIDGFSSCGKSTLAKALASKLRYRYIDTGAMYRAVALYYMRHKMLENGMPMEDLIAELPRIKIDFEYDVAKDRTVTYLNGENVEEEIRGLAVSEQVSKVSQISEVRNVLVKQQQEMGKSRAVVMDGRDIGTRVFPNAEIKFFITANPEVRAERRHRQMVNNGITITIDEVRKNLEERDYDDVHKGDHPLKKAEDAIEIDNTNLGIHEQFETAYNYVQEALASS